jgi:hypothetical protein
MSSKAEYKRTMKKLKEREESVPGVVFMRKRKHRMTGRKVTMSEAEMTGPKQNFGLPVVDEKIKRKGGWKKVDKAPLLRKDRDPLRLTNGVELPNWVVLIKEVRDVKVAKRIARMANSWYRKLYGLEETKLVQEFRVDDPVWWSKKSFVYCGQVVKLKTRKLVVREYVGETKVDWVLPVRKVTKGRVPKEYLQPDPKRWAIGRKAAA